MVAPQEKFPSVNIIMQNGISFNNQILKGVLR
nr:MAG TPA: hypothetical protein [Caudoviricetes sp.]